MALESGHSVQEIMELFSRYAFAYYSYQKHGYVVVYNENMDRWQTEICVLHEIGHIYYGHVSPRSPTINQSVQMQELYANFYTIYFLIKNGGKSMNILTGNEHFTFDDMPIGKLLSDFWAWNSSDLLNNPLRGALAEFIVAAALELDTGTCRKDCTPYDLETLSGIKIEVKASAYLQSWNTNRISNIRFNIGPTRAWDAELNFDGEIKRQSDVYVFCLYASKTKEDTPLLLDQWEFYVIPTYTLNQKCSNQKSISLNSLLSLNPMKTDFGNLQFVIQNILPE